MSSLLQAQVSITKERLVEMITEIKTKIKAHGIKATPEVLATRLMVEMRMYEFSLMWRYKMLAFKLDRDLIVDDAAGNDNPLTDAGIDCVVRVLQERIVEDASESLNDVISEVYSGNPRYQDNRDEDDEGDYDQDE